jgi:hypothetical protein
MCQLPSKLLRGKGGQGRAGIAPLDYGLRKAEVVTVGDIFQPLHVKLRATGFEFARKLIILLKVLLCGGMYYF